MAIKVGDNFSYKGKKPLDSRDSFDTVSEMTQFAETSLDDGHISYVKETDKYYKFNSTNDVDTTLGRWREYTSGGSGEENTIESISVNGSALTPDGNKNVDITVPTVTNDLTDSLKTDYDSAVASKHTHNNKTTIDKLSETSDGTLLFDGKQIEGGSGTAGKSAYEIAVDNGFVGTETEWLESLNGEQGATFTPYVSSSGELSWTNDGDKENPATVNIKGVKGDRGDSGVTTPINGFFTMYVDEDGNLWVLSEDDLTNTFEYDAETGNLYFVQEV